MPTPLFKMKKKFCKRSHNTEKCGRTKYRACIDCEKMRIQARIVSFSTAQRSKQRRKEVRNKVRIILDRLKDKPCLDCNSRFAPWVMDFDHRPGEIKEFEVNKFANVSSITDDKLKLLHREIAKCDLVCSNCHRDRTHRRLIWNLS